jgi:hypothetical protein
MNSSHFTAAQFTQNVSMLTQNVSMLAQNVSMPTQNVSMPTQNVSMPNDETPHHNKCKTCHKVFVRKWCLERHESSCKQVANPLECPKCHKVFGKRQSKFTHMKTCEGTSTALTTLTTNNNTSYDRCNNNTQIHINCYGHEDMRHITNAFKDARLQELDGKGILNFIRSVHFNPDIPTNHNFRKHDSKFCKVFDDGEWIFRSLKSAIADLIVRYKRLLCDRLAVSECEEGISCEVTWRLIWENLMKFDKNKNPNDFFRTIGDVMALMENLEVFYCQKGGDLLDLGAAAICA